MFAILIFFAIPFIILSHLNAVELSSILPTCAQGTNCEITTNYGEITNHSDFRIGANDISINADIGTFINYGTITPTRGNSNQSIAFSKNGHITNFINYGTMQKMFWIANNSGGIDTLTNYGIMGGISHEVANPLTLNNLGIMGTTYRYGGVQQSTNIVLGTNASIFIQNYALTINESPATFNAYNGGTNLAHLVISGNGVSFKDKNSRILLDFGADFELGKEYAINKIVTDTSGNLYSALGVDFSRLIPKKRHLHANPKRTIFHRKTRTRI